MSHFADSPAKRATERLMYPLASGAGQPEMKLPVPAYNHVYSMIHRLLKAIEPIVEATRHNQGIEWHPERDRPDYNPKAHLEITITIEEARALRNALNP